MEAKRRSVAKGLSWRVLATADTTILALIFTGDIKRAISISSIEMFTKIVWYYIHERIWSQIPSEHERYPLFEKFFATHGKMRSALKAISWRFFGAIDTFLIVLVVTGHLGTSISIGGMELVTKILLYYFHEQIWLHIRWGIFALPDFVSKEAKKKDTLLHVTSNPKRVLLYTGACAVLFSVSLSIAYALHRL